MGLLCCVRCLSACVVFGRVLSLSKGAVLNRVEATELSLLSVEAWTVFVALAFEIWAWSPGHQNQYCDGREAAPLAGSHRLQRRCCAAGSQSEPQPCDFAKVKIF
jgi:hypothetical protein